MKAAGPEGAGGCMDFENGDIASLGASDLRAKQCPPYICMQSRM